MDKWPLGGQRGQMVVILLIGFLFGIVTLAVILVVYHLTSGP
jgi:hypothetical protein